ncbi:hypothetical protein EDD16DRAFT_1790593 [Pisolithus croceorrhizus]|nr:hypothetical protein EDD16DRAFT_1790593 [Pisolithus croceorrhizus]
MSRFPSSLAPPPRSSTSGMSSLRLLRQAACSARTFSHLGFESRDIVQELYIKELNSLQALLPSHSLPIQPPKPPTLPVDLATELAAYDAAEPTTTGESCSHSSAGEFGQGAEAFLTFLEADAKPAESTPLNVDEIDGRRYLCAST